MDTNYTSFIKDFFLEKKVISDKQFDILENDHKFIKSLSSVLNDNSLNFKFEEALQYKKSGNFNKAMLYVSEINRDHVTALRKIQHAFDSYNNREKSEVIFRNYRQFIPLEVGIENAPELMDLVLNIYNLKKQNNNTLYNSYYKLEQDIKLKNDELNILYRFDSSDLDIKNIRTELVKQLEELDLKRKDVLNDVLDVCTKFIEIENEESVKTILSILEPMVIIFLSPIITKNAEEVQVER